MRQSICHYSFHRTWAAEQWTCEQLAMAVKDLDVEGVDFHAGLLGSAREAPSQIQAALRKSGRVLSGLSLSNNFNQEDPEEFTRQVDRVLTWLRVAAEVEAPVSRIFGGHIEDRTDSKSLKVGFARIVEGLGLAVQEAEKLGVVLALENHGGLPCTGEEQRQVIRQLNSPYLRATIDVGNYLMGGQEAHEGTALVASYAAYVHFKDYRKITDSTTPWGWNIDACTVGQGDVDHARCLHVLRQAGYQDFITLEYEGTEDEKIGIPESVAFVKQVMTSAS